MSIQISICHMSQLERQASTFGIICGRHRSNAVTEYCYEGTSFRTEYQFLPQLSPPGITLLLALLLASPLYLKPCVSATHRITLFTFAGDHDPLPVSTVSHRHKWVKTQVYEVMVTQTTHSHLLHFKSWEKMFKSSKVFSKAVRRAMFIKWQSKRVLLVVPSLSPPCFSGLLSKAVSQIGISYSLFFEFVSSPCTLLSLPLWYLFPWRWGPLLLFYI